MFRLQGWGSRCYLRLRLLLLCLGLLLRHAKHSVLLGLDASSATLTSGTATSTDSLGLLSQLVGTGLLGLGLVNEFHKDTLVLEHVTLALEVQFVVHVTVDLAYN